MWLRRPLTFRRFKKAVRPLIVALTAGSMLFSLLFTFWGRHSDDTVNKFSAFPRTIGGVGSEDEKSLRFQGQSVALALRTRNSLRFQGRSVALALRTRNSLRFQGQSMALALRTRILSQHVYHKLSMFTFGECSAVRT